MSIFLDSLAQTQEMAKRDALNCFVNYVASYADVIQYADEHHHIRETVHAKLGRVWFSRRTDGTIKVYLGSAYHTLDTVVDYCMGSGYFTPQAIAKLVSDFTECIKVTCQAIIEDDYTEQYKAIAANIRGLMEVRDD